MHSGDRRLFELSLKFIHEPAVSSPVKATTKFSHLLAHATNNDRVDVIGVVMHVEEPSLKQATKVELWLKDESNSEFLVNCWGPILGRRAAERQVGDVVQVNNVVIAVDKNKSVSGSAEAMEDSAKNFAAWLDINPECSRATELRQLPTERGTAISTPWSASMTRGGSLRLKTNQGEAVLACCATAAACSVAMDPSTAADPTQAVVEELVEVVVHGAWLIAIRGEASYRPCQRCRTKVDPASGQCKKYPDCQTDPAPEHNVLATATIADATGVLQGVLIGEEAMCEMTGMNKDRMLAVLAKTGPEALCFRGRYDVRLGTTPHRNQWTKLPARPVPELPGIQRRDSEWAQR